MAFLLPFPNLSLPTLISIPFVTYILWSVLLAVYRVTLHPLARFPGPLLAAVTGWYEFYYDVLLPPGGQYSAHISRLHDIYGAVVRITPDELHIRDSDAYETIQNAKAKHDKYPRFAKIAGFGIDSFSTIGHDIHRKRRAANLPLVAKRAVIEGVPMMRAQVGKLQAAFRSAAKVGEPLELRVTFLAFTTDVAGMYFFERSIGNQDDYAKAETWLTAIHKVAHMAPFVRQFTCMLKPAMSIQLSFWQKVDPLMAAVVGLREDTKTWAREFLNDSKAQAVAEDWAQGKREAAKPPTLFHAIWAHPAPPEEKNLDRLYQEAWALIVAASETSGRVLVRALYELISHPDIMSRVREELASEAKRLGKAIDELTLPELEHLPWLTSVVKESLRVAAVVTGRLPLMRHEEMVYKNWVIPAWTPVSLTPHDVLYDPAIFPDPGSFRPERWLRKADEDGTLRPHTELERYFVPYGKGTRILANAEIYLGLVGLIPYFDFEFHDVVKERDIDYVADCFIGEVRADSPGVRVLVMERAASRTTE